MINAGGDVAVFGEPEEGQPWRVGVRSPPGRRPSAHRGHAGRARPRGGHLGHLRTRPARVRPPLGRGRPETLAATVVGPDLAFVDALATGLLASDGKALARVAGLRGYSAQIVEGDGTVRTTLGFPANNPAFDRVDPSLKVWGGARR